MGLWYGDGVLPEVPSTLTSPGKPGAREHLHDDSNLLEPGAACNSMQPKTAYPSNACAVLDCGRDTRSRHCMRRHKVSALLEGCQGRNQTANRLPEQVSKVWHPRPSKVGPAHQLMISEDAAIANLNFSSLGSRSQYKRITSEFSPADHSGKHSTGLDCSMHRPDGVSAPQTYAPI